MAKQTFLNLTEEKRRRIVNIAMEEFAAHKYGKASLSNIVTRAGIAKGSMYQYFTDKKDLFVHILEVAAQEKIAYIDCEVDQRADFFTALEQSIRASVKFNLEHPKMSRVIANAMEPLGEEALEEIYSRGRQMSIEFFRKLLARGQREGSIRPDVDIRLTASMMYVMLGWGLADFILDCLGMTMQQYLSDLELAGKIPQETLDHLIRESISFLRDGLGTKGK